MLSVSKTLLRHSHGIPVLTGHRVPLVLYDLIFKSAKLKL